MTIKLQGTIAIIKTVIESIGPATAREIETHPEVVAACRSSKAKARRLIERLLAQGHIVSDQAAQQPRFSVQQCNKGVQPVMQTHGLLTVAYYRKNPMNEFSVQQHYALEE